jgi:cation:H+ antiporter
MSSTWVKVALVLAVALPAAVMRVVGVALRPELAVLVFGAAVVASAFLLAWAAEAAQKDISGSMAIAILALIAVLPEYAVDLYFSYTAGHKPEFTQYAAANMTGSNRLLIGIGWPLVAGVAFYAIRRHRRIGNDSTVGRSRATAVVLPEHRRVELGFLAVACVYAFVIPLKGQLAWYDSVVLLALFGAYLWRVSREKRSEPDLIGVAAQLGGLPRRQRRAVVGAMFLAAGLIVVAAAEPFANGLVGSGAALGIDRFLLVQWLAPLASEAPELIVATMFALRLRGDDALGTLLSSKVNQWTLLVGSLPLAYLLGGGGGALHLDGRQTEEFLLTAAQAVLGVAMLVDLALERWEAAALFGLFALQFPFPNTNVRLAFAAFYLAAAAVILIRHRRELRPLFSGLSPWSRSDRTSPRADTKLRH